MRYLLRIGMGVAALAVVAVSAVEAQVFTPTYQSPRLVDEIGFAVSDAPGSLALEGLWRGGPLGLRVGYADTSDGMLMLAGELRNPLPLAGAPMGLAFTAALHALVGDGTAIGGQGGLSAGYTFMGPGLAVTPYIHPRLAAVRERNRDDLRLRALADVGADIEFHTNLLVSLGVALDDVGANWGLGVGWRR